MPGRPSFLPRPATQFQEEYHSVGLPFFSVTASAGQLIGRYVFGFVAVLLNLLAVWAWEYGFRQLRRDLAGELERDEPV